MKRLSILAVVLLLGVAGCATAKKPSVAALNPWARLPMLHVEEEEALVAAFEKSPETVQPWMGQGKVVPKSISDLGLAGEIRLVLNGLYLDGGSHGYLLADEKDRLFAFCSSNPRDPEPAFILGVTHFTHQGGVTIAAGTEAYEFLFRLLWSYSRDPRYQIDPAIIRRVRADSKLSDKEFDELFKEPVLPKPVTDLSAVVIRYNETIPLGTPRREKPFYTVELEIVAPVALEGQKLQVISKDPLPTGNLFRKSGARLRLAVIALEESRGTSMLPSEGFFRTEYKLMIKNVTVLGEELNSISSSASPR